MAMRRALPLLFTAGLLPGLAALLIAGCPSNNPSSSAAGSSGTGGQDAGPEGPGMMPEGGIANPCSLPGSVLFTASGTIQLPGGSSSWPSLSFLHLPAGFCAHYYGTVPNA